MKNSKIFLALFMVVSFHAALAQKDLEIPNGTIDAAQDSQALAVAEEVELELEPSYKYDKADHVANGVAMRNRTSGTIHLRGVPAGSRVVQSLLYFNFSDNKDKGPDTIPVLFNGNLINGRKTADNTDPCWGRVGNHTYVADVTVFTNQTGTPNQDYEVVIVFNETTNTSGENPWTSPGTAEILVEGASLIVVFQSELTTGPLAIYDNLSGGTFSGSFTANLFNPSPLSPGGPDLFTMVGADGQLGGNGYNISATNELTFFNGIQIAGPPVTNSDWDGSDGWPLVQLWDTHTHEVDLQDSTSRVNYQAGADCLTPVAFVLDDK